MASDFLDNISFQIPQDNAANQQPAANGAEAGTANLQGLPSQSSGENCSQDPPFQVDPLVFNPALPAFPPTLGFPNGSQVGTHPIVGGYMFQTIFPQQQQQQQQITQQSQLADGAGPRVVNNYIINNANFWCNGQQPPVFQN